jgi:hypothetical protein
VDLSVCGMLRVRLLFCFGEEPARELHNILTKLHLRKCKHEPTGDPSGLPRPFPASGLEGRKRATASYAAPGNVEKGRLQL